VQAIAANAFERRLNDDYTLSWICAISTECVAAQAFSMKDRNMSPNDNNDYTLGKIGKRNVVIAILPGGEYSSVPNSITAV